METIHTWAARWEIPKDVMSDLVRVLSTPITAGDAALDSISEAAVQQRLQMHAGRYGGRLWRNNNGACLDENNRMIRYGLANVSKKLNERFKSSDLIGVTPVRIGPQHLNTVLGVFTSIEAKKGDWVYRASKKEQAQLNWINLVKNLGGYAGFASKESDYQILTGK